MQHMPFQYIAHCPAISARCDGRPAATPIYRPKADLSTSATLREYTTVL